MNRWGTDGSKRYALSSGWRLRPAIKINHGRSAAAGAYLRPWAVWMRHRGGSCAWAVRRHSGD
ncbi:hypothetical protein KCP71_00930 [Salmonella enterica subsp. enterica]|nr:hypothetical protein KCP71_00930 [Salmonella enterica subsp. enterica]